jgi:2-polyprenyl-3-methyl-5-hydroxy-6-metoxy-1,4-benzoquinol methylase
MACLICRSPRLDVLYEGVRDHYGIDARTYRFLRCQECGSASLDPLPPAAARDAAYSADYTFKPTPGAGVRGLLAALEWRWFYRRGYVERLALIRRLTGLTSGRVLEVGCGSGLFLAFLRQAGYEVAGLDPSKADVEYARERLGVEAIHGDLETPGLATGRYDAVLMIYVLEHIADPHAALARVAALLRPGGWVVLGLPVMDSLQARLLGPRWSAVTEAPRHVHIPSVAGARRLLAGAGFRDVRTAASPLFENAGHVALSLVPQAATPRSYGGGGAGRVLVRRALGALALAPGLALAWAERRGGTAEARAGTMFFCGRR